MRTEAEQKRSERAHWRSLGWKLAQFWVHPLDFAAVRKFIDRKNRKRGKL